MVVGVEVVATAIILNGETPAVSSPCLLLHSLSFLFLWYAVWPPVEIRGIGQKLFWLTIDLARWSIVWPCDNHVLGHNTWYFTFTIIYGKGS